MKKKLLFIWLLLLSAIMPSHAHKEWVHQYMVQQAYLFMENQIGPVPLIKNSVGLNSSNGPFRGAGQAYFLDFPQIAGGAWREDVDDWVYGYTTNPNNGNTPSITHFWTADGGDDVRTVNNGFTYYANAWEKARVYLFCRDRNGSHDVTVPWNNGNGFKKYHITYTSLIEFYKGNFRFNYSTDVDGNNRVEMNYSTQGFTTFSQQLALQILGRVAHLLGDMSVPAHVHSHLHPCPAGLPDYYENHMGGVWYNNSGPTNCESDPGGSFPAQQWTAATAAQTGGLVQEMYCQGDDAAKMRYLFYTNNQLADFFPSGVNDPNIRDADYQNSGPSFNNNYRVGGNSTLPNGRNDYLDSRYNVLNSQGQGYNIIAYKAIGNETFNYSIRAVATLLQWFSYNTGLIQDLQNTPITSTTNKFLFCAGGQPLDLQLRNLPSSTSVSWSITPSTTSTGVVISTAPHTFRVTPNSDPSSGPITVSASYVSVYGPNGCYSTPVTVTRTLWKGPPIATIEYREPTGDADLEPNASFDLVVRSQQELIQGNLTYTWSTYDSGVYLYSVGGAANIQAPSDNAHFFTIYATVANECGVTSISRNFRTKDARPPGGGGTGPGGEGGDCFVCPGGRLAATPTNTGALTTAPLAPGCYVYPLPSDAGFDLYYVRATPTPLTSTTTTPTFTLLDALGRRISTGVLTKSTTHFDTNTLPNGLYLLKIEDNGVTTYKRVQTKH
jgi:hypothetical protein